MRIALRSLLDARADADTASIHGSGVVLPLRELAAGGFIDGSGDLLRGRSVMLQTRSQIATVIALAELDGVAKRLVLCPPGLALGRLLDIMATAEIDAIVTDSDDLSAQFPLMPRLHVTTRRVARPLEHRGAHVTEWALLTSGSTGVPKLIVHTLGTLTGALKPEVSDQHHRVWATFYDIRRFGGLQIVLRALKSGTSLVLSDAGGSLGDLLTQLGAHGVTHISGTPSHWRNVLMTPASTALKPRYIRLSGEIADQAVLDKLAERYPGVTPVHAFASTEAGLAFEVTDGREGFPPSLIEHPPEGVRLKIEQGTLRVRSARMALRTLDTNASLCEPDGFVDTKDMIARKENRYVFAGRRDGVINVGGNKVHPEEVESVINRHPRVEMARVRARGNPITGAIIEADVVLRDAAADREEKDCDDLESEIRALCATCLPAFKTPSAIRIVPSLPLGQSGKLERQHA